MPPEMTSQVDQNAAPPPEGSNLLEGIEARRTSVLDAINAARLETLAEEGFDIQVDAAPPADDPKPPEETPQDPAPAGDPPTETPPLETQNQPELHTVIVDGQEKKVTTEELLRNYTTNQTAHTRLETATQILLRAKQGAEQPAAPAAQPQNADPAADAAARAAETVELVKALQMDDPEQAAAKLEEFFVKRRAANPTAKAPDSEVIVQQAMDRIEWQNALNAFGNDYQDILADNDVAKFTGMKVQEIVAKQIKQAGAEGRPRPSFSSMFADAGNAVRTILGKPAPQPAPKQDSGNGPPATPPANGNGLQVNVRTNDRLHLKRTNPSLPTPARGAPSAPAPAGQDLGSEEAIAASRSSAIAEITASRRPQPTARRA